MKLFISAAVLSILLTSAILISPANDLAFTIKVDGIDQLSLREGLSPSELAPMTIETSKSEVEVSEFEIVLARGSRPVENSVQVIQGNSFDLAAFTHYAKSGDRIVIQLNELDGSEDEELTDQNRAIVIPIK